MVHTSGNPDSRSYNKIPKSLRYFQSTYKKPYDKIRNLSGFYEMDEQEFAKKYPSQYKAVKLYSYIQSKRKKKPFNKTDAVVGLNKAEKDSLAFNDTWEFTNLQTGKKTNRKIIAIPKTSSRQEDIIKQSITIAHEAEHSKQDTEKQPTAGEVDIATKRFKLTPEEHISAYYSLPNEQQANEEEREYAKSLNKFKIAKVRIPEK